MRILLAIFLLCPAAFGATATAVNAYATTLTATTVTNLSAACATTDTTWGHDAFLEGFQTATVGVGDGNTWSTNFVGTVGNIDPVYDISGDSGTTNGMCSQALRITIPTDGTETYVRWTNSFANRIDWWATGATIKMAFNQEYGIGTGDSFLIAQFQDDLGNLIFNIDLDGGSGANRSRAGSYTSGTYATVTTNVWHFLTVTLPAGTTNNATWQFDGGSSSTFTISGYGARTNIAKILLGAPSSLDATDECGPLKFDLISINTP